jgi:hypothetical protein
MTEIQTMKIHLIYHPNRGGSEVRVHKARCQGIAADILHGHGATSHYETEVHSQHEAAEDFYADFIAEESMTPAEAWAQTDFLPCTKGLAETTPYIPLAEHLAAFLGRHGDQVDNALANQEQHMDDAARECVRAATLAVAAPESEPREGGEGTIDIRPTEAGVTQMAAIFRQAAEQARQARRDWDTLRAAAEAQS